jgi:hypothetical protein
MQINDVCAHPGKFLRADQTNQNLKYLGITSLARLVQVRAPPGALACG